MHAKIHKQAANQAPCCVNFITRNNANILVVPTPKSPQTVPINSSFNSKPPIPHLNARYLMLYPSHWHLLEIWRSGGFRSVGPGAYFARFGKGKVHFWSCPDRPLLQDIRILNAVYQCCNVVPGTCPIPHTPYYYTSHPTPNFRVLFKYMPYTSHPIPHLLLHKMPYFSHTIKCPISHTINALFPTP